MNDSFQALMQEATRLTKSGRLTEATQVIQRAMNRAAPVAAQTAAFEAAKFSEADVIDGCVRELDPEMKAPCDASPAPSSSPSVESFIAGEFVRGTQRHGYKLYSPLQQESGAVLPLVVMLHGCTQNPDDFALGTGMNAAARVSENSPGFYVLYPSQPRGVNAQGCWHWFERAHQQRGQGEPGWIAELTQQVLATHRIDPTRVYIAGLSAGGAMAAVVADAYPEVFAAVGIHSGLPVGAASNLTQALTAMKRGSSTAAQHRPTSTPSIVFHGDQDRTVHAVNAQSLVAAATLNAHCTVQTETGQSEFGQKFTRSVYSTPSSVQAEHWQLHGAGHAWSGGSPEGSYTDPRGTDATKEMLRFFAQHRSN
jgi:poly(hydroxyalkanoate) depolymerase family esterase